MEEIDLKELFSYFVKKLKLFIGILVAALLAGNIYTFIFQKPTYQSYSTIILSGADGNKTVTNNDVTLNKNLVTTYSSVATSRRVLDQVEAELGYDYSYGALTSKISVSAITNTEIIKITATDGDPERAERIANVTAKYFVDEVKNLYNLNTISILDEAIQNPTPSNKNIVKQEIIYFAAGAVLGFGVIFLLFYVDRSVKTQEQVESRTGLPVLGRIRKSSGELAQETIVKNDPKANISEDFRTLRTNLQFSLSSSKNAATILVTSSNPKEGKSFNSTNIATAFAEAGKKTILVDADLRLGRIHEIFNVRNTTGLSNMLAEHKTAKFADHVSKTKIKNLSIISRGTVPPNPSELLDSEDMDRTIKHLKEQYDCIIIDGAPISGLSDSLVLGKKVDKTVIVCSTNTTSIDDLDKTVKSLKNIDVKIAGIVMNKVVDKSNKKYGQNNYNNYYSHCL